MTGVNDLTDVHSVDVVVHPDKQALSDSIAARLVTAILDAQAERDVVHLSLTGGSLGSDLWASVAALPAREAVDWSRVELWWGDERYLPAGDPDRNDVQNDEAGLDRLGLRPERVHRVAGPDASASLEESATAYGHEMRADGSGEFDVVLLGVGPDGHVASLFPQHPAQRVGDAVAIPVTDSPKPPPERVSLTFEALNRARQVWFLVAGDDKAEAVAAALRPGADRWDVPAAGVRGRLATTWWLDEPAASRLDA